MIVYFLVYALSIDCGNIKTLALGLNMDLKQPQLFYDISKDCCNSTGITCVDSRVTEVFWKKLSLDGAVNSSLIPPFVTYLDLSYNNLVGEVPSIYSPKMICMYLNDNKLNGSLPIVYPSSLSILLLRSNQLTGGIPPSIVATVEISLSNNFLTGPIPTLPSLLKRFYAGGNRLTGLLPTFSKNLQVLYLGTQFNTPNKLSGTLRLEKPSMLYINGNYITDIIIQDSSLLTPSTCDLSNNPLLDNANIKSVNCLKNGLYSPSVLLSQDAITLNSVTSFSSVNQQETTTTLISDYTTTHQNNYSISDISSQKEFSFSVETIPTSKFPITKLSSEYLKLSSVHDYVPKAESTNLYYASSVVERQSKTSIEADLKESHKTGAAVEEKISLSAPTFTFEMSYYSNEADFTSMLGLTSTKNIHHEVLFMSDDDINGIETQSALTDYQNPKDPGLETAFSNDDSGLLVYWLFSGFIATCIVVLVASKFFKHPKIQSRFGRRNSFSTLNTVGTKHTA
eukprot:NODE_232_length_13679_cov_0.197349.p4 type:complete len:510 gc:universal NODE_232_length_13679_cov_0.197349:6678-5149(-)